MTEILLYALTFIGGVMCGAISMAFIAMAHEREAVGRALDAMEYNEPRVSPRFWNGDYRKGRDI